MLVRDYMSQPPIVISPKTPISEALRMMRERGIRRFPVVDLGGRLVGIVSDKDLLHAEPSPATSLSIWEITYLLGRITVEQVMTRDVLTVGPTTPLEEAARIMVDRKIGGLPVVEADLVLGVITETDIFRVFALILGANERGTGVTVTAIDRPRLLADLTGATALAGGDITAILTYPADGGSKTSIFMKVRGVSMEQLTAVIRPHVERIDYMRKAGGGSWAGAST
jgi:acetoin utilization protein AcuB